jgi:signal transduction histidine kinase
MENACRYAEPRTEIRLEINRTDDNSVTLEVTNMGPPIPPEIRDRLFELGFSHGPGAGSGVGLYLVKRIVEAHHGTVDVRSERSHSDAERWITIFRIRLPL